MAKKTISEKVKEIICRNIGFKLSIDQMTGDSNIKDLGMNSINFIKTLVDLESEFNIEFEDDELDMGGDNVMTIDSFVKFIKIKI